jgi:FAD dependent oxidoreductase TIGR03364
VTAVTDARVVVVGAGIVGVAHAITARESGYAVTVCERDGRPLGASVRNFGTLWPLGCADGAEREQARQGVRRWREVAERAGIWLAASGSLSLAYREEAWAVLGEYAAGQANAVLLEPAAVQRRFPAANGHGLRGALYSPEEAVVHPPSAMAGLVAYARSMGVVFHFGTPVVRVEAEAVETADGRRLPFDHLVVAAGEETRLLFPGAIAAAGVRRCRLQMLRTVPQPAGYAPGAIYSSDLTLCHYPAFRACPSTARLRARLEAELPAHAAWGVHVLAAPHFDGSLTVGDSHEHGEDFDPEWRTDVEQLILAALAEFLRLPDPRVASRWHGTYLRSTRGETQVVVQPQERVTLVTALGGLGMTLSWGLAQQTVDGWAERSD